MNPVSLGDYCEYFRDRSGSGDRYFKRNRRTGKTQETSFEDMLRSHQIARTLIDEKRGMLGEALDGHAFTDACEEARSEAKQIERGFIA